jgi:energy-coupling factor transporter ATP-binding protein EcfA2/energy-coupling factor transporter transmembrane protein EcfT
MIDIRNLTYRYTKGERPVLDDVTLHVGEGEFVVVTGPSGCGKSTLALAIGGFLHHQFDGELHGSVRVAGLDVGERSLFEIADVVGLVQQNPENQFCTLTVRDEVAFGLENRCLPPATIASLCDEALDIVGAAYLADRDLATLSGGEKQKVAVASMLAARPKVIVFDEPTSNLDPTATQRIFAVLGAVRRRSGVTIVIIEHKLDGLRRFAPRLVRMEAGRIVASDASLPPAAPRRVRAVAAAGEPLVHVEDLCVAYGDVRALDGVSATFSAGQLVALMGDNGSGKSTLLRSLMGLVPPSAGRVSVLGRTIGARDRRRASPAPHPPLAVSDLARDAGFLFQNPDHQLVGDTVWDDATLLARNLGVYETVAPHAEHLLDTAGLADRRDDNPFRLSYGQKRRLNVIAVTAHAPCLVLADEVLIGQDPANAARLMDRLRAIADGGACVILALHDPQAALAYADRLLFLSAGGVLVDDAPAAALERLASLGYGGYADGYAGGDGGDDAGAPEGDATVEGTPLTGAGRARAPRADSPTPPAAGLVGLHPLLKLGWLLAVSVAAFALRVPAHVVALLVVLVLAATLGGVDLRRGRFFGLAVWSATFLLLLQALFYRQGETLVHLWPFAGGRWPVTDAGVLRGVRVGARFLVIVLSSQAFVLSTDPGALAYALMRAGLPYRFGFALVTALRLVPIFRTEATTVYQAQLVRGVRYDALRGHLGHALRRAFLLLRQLMLPLIISALRKVDALAVSMEGRQFGRYPRRTYLRRADWRPADWAGAALLIVFGLTVTWLAITTTG